MKLCGLYIRVSTDRQAMVEEGSLKNQDQILTHHIDMKSKLSSDRWVVVERYVDEGKSAKDTNRPAYQRMIEDVKQKKINTVVCVALSRISRSTRDLLDLVDFFEKHGVDFVCLKEDVDTTSPMGRLLLTFMGGLNQFEREQTGERTRAACLARAERGLWNGGYLFGYDLDKRKGYMLLNDKEAEVVRFTYQTYLKTGSIIKTRQALNQKGCLTKGYTSRRGKVRPPCQFSNSSVGQMLNNVAYTGKRAINRPMNGSDSTAAAAKPELVNGSWPAIIEDDAFNEVQRLMAVNKKTNNNGQVAHKHFYLLNGGLLYCHKCGSVMEGRNGHGAKGKRTYYYYVCRYTGCRFKLGQSEAENAIAALTAKAAQGGELLSKIVVRLNKKLKKYQPELLTQKRDKESELRCVNQEAQALLSKTDWVSKGKVFLEEELDRLAQKRHVLENELTGVQSAISTITSNQVDEEAVRGMLQNGQQIFGNDMPPYKRKELLKLVFSKFEMSDQQCMAGVDIQTAMRSRNLNGILSSDRSPALSGEPH